MKAYRQLQKQLYDITTSTLFGKTKAELILTLMGEKPVTEIPYKHRDLVEEVGGIHTKKVVSFRRYRNAKVGYEHLPEEIVETIEKAIPPRHVTATKGYDLLVSTDPNLLHQTYSWYVYGKKKHGETLYHAKRDEELGKLFGYPDCCIKAYVERSNLKYSQFRKKVAQLPAEQQFYFEFVSHVPCSIDCQKSLEMGRKRAGIIAKYAPGVYQEIKLSLERMIMKKEGRQTTERVLSTAFFTSLMFLVSLFISFSSPGGVTGFFGWGVLPTTVGLLFTFVILALLVRSFQE